MGCYYFIISYLSILSSTIYHQWADDSYFIIYYLSSVGCYYLSSSASLSPLRTAKSEEDTLRNQLDKPPPLFVRIEPGCSPQVAARRSLTPVRLLRHRFLSSTSRVCHPPFKGGCQGSCPVLNPLYKTNLCESELLQDEWIKKM